jgi:CHAD domain-containing protein
MASGNGPEAVASFALKLGRPVGAEMVRLLREQLEMARAEFGQGGAAVHQGIHQGRRAMRRARAVLLLARPSLDPAHYDDMVEPLRQAGRLLTPLRDAQSVIEAVERHRDELQRAGAGAAIERLLKRLARRRNAVVARRQAERAAARECIATALQAVDRGFDGLERRAIWDGLDASLRRTRRAMRRAIEDGADENVHRFRQRARALWLQLDLLRPLWPEVVGAQCDEVKRISQALGAERDLVLLERVLVDGRGNTADSIPRVLLERLGIERAKLRRKAFRLGKLLFAERPAATVARLKAYGDARRARAPEPAAAVPS